MDLDIFKGKISKFTLAKNLFNILDKLYSFCLKLSTLPFDSQNLNDVNLN